MTKEEKKEYDRNWREANRERIVAREKAHREANKERIAAQSKAYYEANKERVLSRCKAYNEANKERIAAYRETNKERTKAYYKAWRETNKERTKAYYKANKDAVNAHASKRRASKLNRTPAWLTEQDHEQIKALYKLAKDLTKKTGVKYVVDHYYPLRGTNVSGLHCPLNLQVIPATENSQKKNKHPDQFYK